MGNDLKNASKKTGPLSLKKSRSMINIPQNRMLFTQGIKLQKNQSDKVQNEITDAQY